LTRHRIVTKTRVVGATSARFRLQCWTNWTQTSDSSRLQTEYKSL